MSVHFRFDWVDAGPAPDKLSQCTMAALSIDAGGTCITAAVDRESRIYSSEIVVPLFGVAEWLVTHWWHLWYEVGDMRGPRPAFDARHNLALAGDGFALPHLRMTPVSGNVRLEWTRHAPRHARIEFVDAGCQNVERAELEPQFRNLIDAVLERLHGQPGTGAAADSLGRAWNAVNNLDAEELEFSRAAALLGIDPLDVPDPVADGLIAFWEQANPSVREDALAVASEDTLGGVAAWLNEALAALADIPQGGGWQDVRQGLPPPTGVEPRARGYELARAVRAAAGGNGGRFDFHEDGPLAVPRRETRPPTRSIHGLVGADTPACMTTPRGAAGIRFLQARALGDYLGRSAPGHGLLGSLETDRQAQSRAFAAELLAPADALRRRLADDPVDDEQIEDLGRAFGVSGELVRRQIENHGLAKITAC